MLFSEKFLVFNICTSPKRQAHQTVFGQDGALGFEETKRKYYLINGVSTSTIEIQIEFKQSGRIS